MSVIIPSVYYMGVAEEDLDEWIELCEDKCDRLVLLASVRGQRSRPGLSDSLLVLFGLIMDR